MNSNWIVLIVLIINIFIAVGVYLWDVSRDNGRMRHVHLIVILAFPILGAGFFLGAYILLRTALRDKELTYGDISFDSARHTKKQKSNFLEEVDILPLEEAFTVSETADRRRALLTTLKKDYSRNISTVLRGLDNDDSETSHYAASVVLTTTSDYLNLLSKLRTEFEEDPTEHEPARAYLNCLKEFMLSDILDNVDKKKYARIYLEVFSTIQVENQTDITDEDYVFITETLIEINDEESAEVLAERAIREFPDSDIVYYSAMKMYYRLGNMDRFFELLDVVMGSEINISNDTLQMIRFFTFQQ